MDFTKDTFEKHLPHYLCEETKTSLMTELKKFPDEMNYYLSESHSPSDYLQGDTWTPIEIIDYVSIRKVKTKGIIISNTCDVSHDNKRDVPARVCIAPIMRLSLIEKLLKEKNISPTTVNNKITAIKKQAVTNTFYLPRESIFDEDYVAFLDNIHSIPLKTFCNNTRMRKVVSLSQSGFYLFLVKLSIHFCRFNEGIDRYKL